MAALERDLKDGSFNPLPLRRKFILKEPGKFRPLGIPAVRDRVAQEVLRRLLDPIFEPLFHDASFGFRPKRNCHQALELVLKFHEAGYRVVLDADIKGFFDNLPLAIIMEAVAAQVADGNILRLIEKFLRCGVMEDGVFKPTTIGTPQGGVIQPHRGDAGHTRRVAGGGGGCIGGPQPGGFARGRELRRGAGVWHPPAVRVAAVRALGAGTSREVDDGRARRTGGTGEVSDHPKLDWPVPARLPRRRALCRHRQRKWRIASPGGSDSCTNRTCRRWW